MNWYPGHMKKTYDMLKENLRVVDLVIIILDSRVPNSSLNPQLDKLITNKEKIYLMNKSDISDEKVNKEWLRHFENKNFTVVENNSIKNKKNKKLFDCISKVENKIRIKFEKKGFKNKTIRILVVGVPNTGKSTFINYLTKKKSVKTGNKPGVTRGKQWIKIKNKYEILDTPGILWPNLNNLKTNEYKGVEDILEKISRNKGYLLKDNEIDYERCAITILKDFRNGDLGKISLERPKEG